MPRTKGSKNKHKSAPKKGVGEPNWIIGQTDEDLGYVDETFYQEIGGLGSGKAKRDDDK